MYPLKFENLYYKKIWGGERLKRFRDNVPEGKIGESWDVACHRNGISVVSNGEFKGIRLDQLIDIYGEKLLGSKISKERFPLLVKILDSNDKLSVQVHPDDKYALTNEGEVGKTETWYIMDAQEGASIILGTKNCTKEEFKEAIENDNIDEYLNVIQVRKGDVYYIKPGLIHSLGPGITAIEIQQNSDITYRVYDYNRGREVHIEKAFQVMDFRIEGKKSRGIKIESENYDKTYYCLNPHFVLELYDIRKNLLGASDKERFHIYTCVEGEGTIIYNNGEEKLSLGDSIFIPASLGRYQISGSLKLLKFYVPCVPKVEKEILEHIR
ncbi:mannose-6-phosphate isomerase, class I [Tepidimicrobium xylanilyticum]|uniref:mannose-6-phosphate isomerase n=1 Tax=Tepidimicrobium xylanilyticum TaxID=1123352 RepID=A0A1H2WCY8_9FIRM|nr:mannose-6-phosphate isomerase, class I [Tepidimicrobium xylanilyticum]GMG95279.1 mannose-6-phosphate isomerase [Tepidimicrobium xylanilyticum]SDW78411.1 mannose-6-phosphate isomerase, type 1 [Tepidimicrobium xylanilyticum]